MLGVETMGFPPKLTTVEQIERELFASLHGRIDYDRRSMIYPIYTRTYKQEGRYSHVPLDNHVPLAQKLFVAIWRARTVFDATE